MYLILMLVLMVLGLIVSSRLKSKFKEYSQTTLGNGMSGKEIAEKMLRDNGIYDVSVVSVEGMLTDHYNPANKTVNLSHDVYYGRTAAAAAVSAHECGHAVQHATAYSMLQMRSALVPVVQFGSNWVQWILLAGIFTINTFPSIMLLGILLFALLTIFSIITLPVEFDASQRALVWLESSRTTTAAEHDKAKDALKWAAMTYVIAAISSIATLLYYLMIYMGRRD